MAVPMRIQHLQLAGGTAAAVCCLLLGGGLIASSLGDFERADRTAAGLTRFHAIVVTADAIAAERGPANTAMDPATEPGSRGGILAEKRAATDGRIARARRAFDSEIAGSPDLRAKIDAMEKDLAAARATIDAIAALPGPQRSGPAIAGAIKAMFAVSDHAAGLRSDLGQRLIQDSPNVTSEIMLQTGASIMREEAGRLGSYTVMLLTGGLSREAASLAVERSTARIQQSWLFLSSYGRAYIDDDSFRQALEAVETQYFGHSLPLAHATVAAYDGGQTPGASRFTQDYVPGLGAPIRLSERVDAISRQKLERERREALSWMLGSASLTVLVVLIIGALATTLRNRLFRPLLAAREEVLAIAGGDLSEPVRRGPVAREIGDMFAGLATLRQLQHRKQVLECERERMTEALRTLSETDALTGLLNRRALIARASEILREADRRRTAVALILIDIDHFKSVNDTHGHAAGDRVLQEVGALIRPALRPGDLIARYGGEEFLVVIEACGRTEAMNIAERLRLAFHTASLGETDISVTGSFGVAVRPAGTALDWETLVAVADRQLYRAKQGGRNRVCTAGRGEMPSLHPCPPVSAA